MKRIINLFNRIFDHLAENRNTVCLSDPNLDQGRNRKRMRKNNKLIYIAHPVRGDREKNLYEVARIVREINLSLQTVTPIAPYFLDCQALDDNIKEERERGIGNSLFVLRRCDEVWLYGDHISEGMEKEIEVARLHNIPVRGMSAETRDELTRYINRSEFPNGLKINNHENRRTKSR